MERFYKRKSLESVKNVDGEPSNRDEFDVAQLPTDPGLRPPILDYNVNIRDHVRRAFMQKGPCQPLNHEFKKRQFGDKEYRRFNPFWFNEFGSWLEYSVAKEAAFCLCCYLFKTSSGKQGGGDSFVGEGFTYWKDKKRLVIHVGKHNSSHNQARIKCEALMNQEQHIQSVFFKQSEQMRNEYRVCLIASIDCVRVLLRQGHSFRGHDESENSLNPGNFLVQLQFLADHNNEVKAVTLKNAPQNCKLTSPKVQKDIVRACAAETMDVIIKDLGDSLFSILVDESRDVSTKEQMSVVLRYVSNGLVNERFIGLEHVSSTTAVFLKAAIDKIFSRYNLSISNLRGQGYDGASNMQGRFNGLKALILNENPSAFYIHCFAHQLQLALVAVAKKNRPITEFFHVVADVVNNVGGSSKRCDLFREKQSDFIVKALENGDIVSGRGLNQEITLQRACDTRWGSHYNSLVSLTSMFTVVIDVLEIIAEDESSTSDKKNEALNLLESIQSFDFVFNLHLMRSVLGISNDLSKALQRKDQDIVNAMDMVKVCKKRLQLMRDDGWDSFLQQVFSFCQDHYVDAPNMDSMFMRRVHGGRPHRNPPQMTNLHHFRVDLFYTIIDMQLQELNDRFSEVNTELLLCVACLCPQNSFSAFDKRKLIQFAEFYPRDFSKVDLFTLDDQLDNYIFDILSNKEFEELNGLGALAQKLVLTKKNRAYPLVYKLLTLSLILPVATATVERVFSVMNIVKNRLRNSIGDEWMNDSLIVYVEKDILLKIDNEVILQRYQSMKTRKELL